MINITREECEKSCLYLLKHCYEEELIKDGTYTFTASGFKESEIFKQLIEEHYDNPPLKFEELKENMWVWDNKIKAWFLIKTIKPQSYWNIVIYANYLTDVFEEIRFEENRFYRKQVE